MASRGFRSRRWSNPSPSDRQTFCTGKDRLAGAARDLRSKREAMVRRVITSSTTAHPWHPCRPGRRKLDRFLRTIRHRQIRQRRRPPARPLRDRLPSGVRPLPRPPHQRRDRDGIRVHPRHDRRRLVARDEARAQCDVHGRRGPGGVLPASDGAVGEVVRLLYVATLPLSSFHSAHRAE